jgi:uncharacterized membrane protein YkgB
MKKSTKQRLINSCIVATIIIACGVLLAIHWSPIGFAVLLLLIVLLLIFASPILTTPELDKAKKTDGGE